MERKMYRQNKAVIFKKEGDEGIIFNPEATEILVLNTTACFIWCLCDGAHSKEDMAQALLDNFDADHKNIVKDLDVFLTQLENKKFIQEIR